MTENKLTVGQIAQKFGISARAVRHYENIGLLESERDTESNYRLYGEAEADRVYQIMLLKSMGFTLKETAAIISSNGNKNGIIKIIDIRLKSLTRKAQLFDKSISLLNDFLLSCSKQENECIDSFRLLDEILTSRDKAEMLEESDRILSTQEMVENLKKDKDLYLLKGFLCEDLNPLFLPFVVGREDGDLLENYFVNHRKFWGLGNITLSDGTNLEEVYNPYTFSESILEKMGEVTSDSLRTHEEIGYKDIVIGLCETVMGMEYNLSDSVPALELKLVCAVFKRALDMLELAGHMNGHTIGHVAEAIQIEKKCTSKFDIEESIELAIQMGGIQAFYICRLVDNAIKRNRYVGSFYVLTEASAFFSSNWELDRALDMAVGFLWTHEIHPSGQPNQTLFPVVIHIAYMRARMLYAPSTYIQPDIKKVDSFMIIGSELITTDRNGEAFTKVPQFEEEFVLRRMNELIPNRTTPGLRYGLNCRHRGGYYSFIAGEQVCSLEEIPDGMTGETIPEGIYAVFIVNGGPLPFKVVETIIYAYQQWLPASEYQWDSRPGFNLYFNASGRSDSDIRIYIPIKAKGE